MTSHLTISYILKRIQKVLVGYTSVARILQWRGFENDITFDYTLYTGTDPESFGGIDVFLNQLEC